MSRKITAEAYLVDHHEDIIKSDKIAMMIYTNVNVRFHHLGKEFQVSPDQDCQTLLLAIRYLDDEALVSTMLNEEITIDDHVNQKFNVLVFLTILGVGVFSLLYVFYVHETHSEPAALMDLVKALSTVIEQLFD